MNEQPDKPLSRSEITKKAYLAAQRLKHSGLEDEVVMARLEKEGIPLDIIKQVMLDQIKDAKVKMSDQRKERSELKHNTLVIKIGLTMVASLILRLIFPDHIIIPFGTIVGGIAYALFTESK